MNFILNCPTWYCWSSNHTRNFPAFLAEGNYATDLVVVFAYVGYCGLVPLAYCYSSIITFLSRSRLVPVNSVCIKHHGSYCRRFLMSLFALLFLFPLIYGQITPVPREITPIPRKNPREKGKKAK